jgi:hypothetical protein
VVENIVFSQKQVLGNWIFLGGSFLGSLDFKGFVKFGIPQKSKKWESYFSQKFVFGVFDTFLGDRGYAIKRQKHCGNSLQCYVAGKRK